MKDRLEAGAVEGGTATVEYSRQGPAKSRHSRFSMRIQRKANRRVAINNTEKCMEEQAAKTIDDFRENCRQSRKFCETHDLHPGNAHSQLASIVLESLASTGSEELFMEVEEEVRRMILRDLRHYKRTGKRTLIYPHRDRCEDGRSKARAAIATLAAAQLVPQSMTLIAMPLPKFIGLEWIRGMDPLNERLKCDDALLDVELVALAQEVPNPRAYPQSWKMSLLITEHQRCDIDERFYERIPVRSCIATFGLHKSVSLYFWPRFSFGFVDRVRVSQEVRRRGQTALQIKLDMHGKGRLYCRDMELLRLEDISCAFEA